MAQVACGATQAPPRPLSVMERVPVSSIRKKLYRREAMNRDEFSKNIMYHWFKFVIRFFLGLFIGGSLFVIGASLLNFI
ncbi:hypothetical protein [Pontibacillus chungwhensis]|uniref:Uncharacterized protein n=1 Tax=Pontibacillus chungwhensis TaxID=265426 RepID=A0ABY8UYV8_9BACI|nr:hypothetical protein [Pontibacillus chungwhensis]WIF98553.1 hypothetical protein QNI29_02470 [Pontibacillus chungwhensis]